MTKICIIFFGLLRNLKITLPHIRKNIFIALEKQGIKYDIYIHTYKINILNSPRSREHNIKYDNNQISLFKHPSTKFIIDNQDEIDKTLRFPEILSKTNPWPEDPTKSTMKNLIRQYYSLKRAFAMVKKDNKEYDGYLFLRPDLLYLNPFILTSSMSLPVNKYHFYSSPKDNYNGVNDRFCFTSRYGAEIYSSRLDEVYDESNIHSETFLKKHLLKYNMTLLLLNISTFRVRANGIIK